MAAHPARRSSSPKPHGSHPRAARNKAVQIQGILDTCNNKSKLVQSALTGGTEPATAPTGIESLPAELTDQIWYHAFGPAVSKKAKCNKPGDMDAKLGVVMMWPADNRVPRIDRRFFARGIISGFYSLKPPLVAQICHASREYAFEQYGLANTSNKAIRKKRSNNKRRWTYECPIPVVEKFFCHMDILHRASIHGIHGVSIQDFQTWASVEDITLSLPLDVLLHDHDRVILNLDTLRHPVVNPFRGFNLALLDLLLSANDHEIAISLPWNMVWHSSVDRCLDRNPSLAHWAYRKSRWVSINDSAVFRELARISDNVCSKRLQDLNVDIATMVVLGNAEMRALLSRRALKPFQDLWERVSRERIGTSPKDGIVPATATPLPLRPLPLMDVVVEVKFDYSEGKTWCSRQEGRADIAIKSIDRGWW